MGEHVAVSTEVDGGGRRAVGEREQREQRRAGIQGIQLEGQRVGARLQRAAEIVHCWRDANAGAGGVRKRNQTDSRTAENRCT